MAIAEGTSPALQEWASGPFQFYHGDLPWTFGVPEERIPSHVVPPLTPARIIVRAARSVGLPAYAVYQPGDVVLPSVVFEASTVEMLDTWTGPHPMRAAYLVTVRAKRFVDVENYTTKLQNALRKDPSGRVHEIGTGLDDGFAPQFEYRMRSFQIVVQT